ncbi:hypothetical protein [Enterococcus sp. DIV2163]|uniref:hypothetical protein n=1 Tax=Enterococcus sp. DIV2163 TaxID=2774834 RepID=UPI003D2FC1A4
MSKKIGSAVGLGRNTFHYWNSEMAQINLFRGGNPDPTFIRKSKPNLRPSKMRVTRK